MDRFKITESGLKKAYKFIRYKKGSPPVWATKYKDDLSIKGTKLMYKDREIVSRDKVDDVLRFELYKKDGDMPSGRDAAFHICKKRYLGISRRALMDFIRAQKPLGEVKAALNKAKSSGGERLKNYVFETDLIFLKKGDLEKANRKFNRDEINDLTYFLSTVEKVTGLCKFDHVLSKKAQVVTPLVIKHCEALAKQLKTTIGKCDIRMDRGGEFSITELKKHFKKADYVNSGVAVENKNAQFQKCFFQILRQRKATDIHDAMQQSEKLLNNTYNRIHKKTSNELVERNDEKKDIKEYNDKRTEHIAGDKRKDFEVDQHVRILVKDKKPGIDYKRYKNKTYSTQVYIIKKTTKKAVPKKYRVNGRWYLQSDLLKSAPRDKKSIELVDERDKAFTVKRKKEHEKHLEEREKEIEKKPAGLRRSKRAEAEIAKWKMLAMKDDNFKIDEQLDDDEITQEKSWHLEKKKAKLEKNIKQLKSKNTGPKKTPQHIAYIKYLKGQKQPTGGSEAVLRARVDKYKKKKNKKKVKSTKTVKEKPAQNQEGKSAKHLALIKYAVKKGLSTDGTEKALRARVRTYKMLN